MWIQFQGALCGIIGNEQWFSTSTVIFPMIPPTIPAPGVREQTASWNNVTALVLISSRSLLEQGSSVKFY